MADAQLVPLEPKPYLYASAVEESVLHVIIIIMIIGSEQGRHSTMPMMMMIAGAAGRAQGSGIERVDPRKIPIQSGSRHYFRPDQNSNKSEAEREF
jgi:hypothetical protein